MKGSEWNKWDLHIHSPMTWLANEFNGPVDVPEFVNKLGESGLSMIGLTNYFYFAYNEVEIIRDEISRQGLYISVLPNVEFRLVQPNKEGDWINIHCIFAENVSTAKINQSLSSLQIATKSSTGRPVYCSEISLRENSKGIDEITVDFKTLCDHISSHFELFRECIIAVCPNGYGGYRPNGKGRSQEVATQIDREGHIILDSSNNSLPTREYFLMTDRYSGAGQKPVFRCSDAHGTDKTGTKFSWVKAKPTFEGLRQTLLEPESRLQPEEGWPQHRTPKVHFSRIELGGSIFDGQPIRFKKQSIPLNEDLVAIIGGRGTGKSLMLDGLQSRFTPSRPEKIKSRPLSLEHLSVDLNKTQGEVIDFSGTGNSYSYLHVSQGEIKELCQEPDKISTEIKKMLRLSPHSFPPQLKSTIERNLSDFRTSFDFFNVKNDKGERINTPNFHNAKIQDAQKHIETLTSENNRHLISTFQENSRNIADSESWITILDNFRTGLINQETLVNENIALLHEKNMDENLIPLVSFSSQIKSLDLKLKIAADEKIRKQEINKGIVEQFRQQGFEQDISGLLDKITDYQRIINASKADWDESQRRIDMAKHNISERKEFSEQALKHIIQEKEIIDIAFLSLSEKKPHYTEEQHKLIDDILQDIEIYGEISFDRDAFYAGALKCMNGGRFRGSQAGESPIDKIAAVLNVNSLGDYKKLIAGENIISVPDNNSGKENINIGDFFWKQEFFNSGGPHALLSYIFSPDKIAEYLTVKAEFRYKGKTVEKLSAGQRGTFYVCLKLATDPFGSPFVFDQPEDDLDNDFIMHHLVPLFRKIKKYRQVIIVTHNANLVVNCDAEQVLVASNNDEMISYRCGALEDGEHAHDNTMRGAICDVLEGGHRAFEQRERKYGLLRPLL